MAIEGSLDDFRLPEILQMVAQQQKTGILTIQGDATIVAVSFLSGRVVAADSLEETVEQRLGEVLMRRGLVTRSEFGEVAERERRGEGRLVDLLVASGQLERQQVLDSLRQQTEELLTGLLDWEQGEFKFYGNDEVSYEEGFEPISVESLLLSSLYEEAEPPPAEPTPGGPLPSIHRLGDPEPDLDPRGLDDDGGGGLDEDSFDVPGLDAPLFDSPHFEAPGDAPPEADEAPPLGPRPVPELTADEEKLERTGVFVPPTAVTEPPPRPAGRATARLADAVVPVFGFSLAVLLLAGVALASSHFLLPLPWQQGERLSQQAVERQAAYQAIDRAAKTFFLLEGRFPDGLDTLREMSMLDGRDLTDPAGVPLVYTAQEDSYELAPELPPEQSDALVSIEAITGNFLLDPEFLSAGPTSGQSPLVLLD
ncbi:MAG TPA: DUF4388 domain-containing protein [Thermoanaerobaculia bacterium]|nr:DUF4388 domain-containing protein [Thermoanaerobaculia bacterium]